MPSSVWSSKWVQKSGTCFAWFGLAAMLMMQDKRLSKKISIFLFGAKAHEIRYISVQFGSFSTSCYIFPALPNLLPQNPPHTNPSSSLSFQCWQRSCMLCGCIWSWPGIIGNKCICQNFQYRNVNDQFWQHNQWFDMEYFYHDEEDDGI